MQKCFDILSFKIPRWRLYTGAGEIHALVALEDSVIFASTQRAIRVIENQAAA